MMNGAPQSDVYENFEPRRDSLFFRVDRAHGLICFHGRNYNIKKRLSADERNRLLSDSTFFRLDSNCYVNAGKISGMDEDAICFGDTNKRIPLSRRNKQRILNLLSAASKASGT
jgi:hypothetical protein